jgi:hypothetical protein
MRLTAGNKIKHSIIYLLLSMLFSSVGFTPVLAQEALTVTFPDGSTAPAGRLKVLVSVPNAFDPQSVKFWWGVGDWKISKLDGSKTSSIIDNPAQFNALNVRAFENALDGMVKVSIRDLGRKVELNFLSMLAVKVSVNVVVTTEIKGKLSSITTPITFKFSPSNAETGVVANIPEPDKFSLDVNNPDPGNATSTKVSVSLGDDAPNTMALNATSVAFGKSYWVFRVSKNGVPIGPVKELSASTSSKVWASFDITQTSYKAAGAIFRVVSGQVFPDLDQLKKSNLANELCGACRSGWPVFTYFYRDFEYKIPFKEKPLNLIKFQWTTSDFSNLTDSWKNPIKAVINDNNYGYERFYFRFQRDITKLPPNAVCESAIVDLQYQKAGKWISVWSIKGYGGNAPAGGFTYLNCLNTSLNNNSQTYFSRISPDYMNTADTLPYPSPELPVGDYKFRFALKIKYFDEDERIVGPDLEETFESFPVKYIFTPDDPELEVSVTYPRLVAYKSKNIVSVTTSPKSNGTCSYYLFNRIRIPVGKAPLVNGKSKLTVQALSMNVGNNLATSITVVCKTGNLEGTGGVLFFVTK